MAVSSRKLTRAEAVVDGFASTGHAFACDAEDTDAIKAFVNAAAAKMGGIDGVLYIPTYMGTMEPCQSLTL